MSSQNQDQNTLQKDSECPFGPQYQVYWNMRYALFEKFDQARVDATALYTLIPEGFALELAKKASGGHTLDICSGVGAMSIALARQGQRVTSVELDPERVAMARHNAGLYDVAERIDFRTGDITSAETLDALPDDIHTLFLDPPWGNGPGDYRRRPVTYLEHLQLAGLDLRELVSRIRCKEVMMRFPPNFDVGILEKISGEKVSYVTPSGYLHWYFLRTSKRQFLTIPDRSS